MKKTETVYPVLRSTRFKTTGSFRTAALLVALALLVVVLVCSPWSSRFAWAQQDLPPPSVSFLDEPLELQLEDDETKVPVKVFVRNGSSEEIDLEFSTALRDKNGGQVEGVSVEPQSPTRVKADSVSPADLEIDTAEARNPEMPLKGYLVVSGTGVAPGTLPLTVSNPMVLPDNLWVFPTNLALLLGPFMLAFVVVILGSFGVIINTLKGIGRGSEDQDVHLFSSLGTGLNLDFGKSWTSVLTVVAAIVTAVTGAEVFPEERPYLTEEQISGLILFFGGMLAFAPALYNLIRRQRPVTTEEIVSTDHENPAKDEQPQLQGYVWTFVVASALILGALLGQLLIAGFMVYQASSTAMSFTAKVLLIGAVGVLASTALVYAKRTVHSAVEEKKKKKNALKRHPNLHKTHFTREGPHLML